MSTALVAVGNPLMGDEGIGIQIIEWFWKHPKMTQTFDCLEISGSLFELIDLVSHYSKIIFVDCAFMGALPGKLRRFQISHIQSLKTSSPFSLHSNDLIDDLQTALTLNANATDSIILYGIEPAYVGPRPSLSPDLFEKIPLYAQTILQDFDQRI